MIIFERCAVWWLIPETEQVKLVSALICHGFARKVASRTRNSSHTPLDRPQCGA